MSWIKVEDRLPEDCVSVLICLRYGGNKRHIQVGFYDAVNDVWMYHGNNVLVKHWQPLPELPDEDN
jgi:hypothetical protein